MPHPFFGAKDVFILKKRWPKKSFSLPSELVVRSTYVQSACFFSLALGSQWSESRERAIMYLAPAVSLQKKHSDGRVRPARGAPAERGSRVPDAANRVVPGQRSPSPRQPAAQHRHATRQSQGGDPRLHL